MTYFNIIGAYENEVINIRVYQKTKFPMIQEGRSYSLKNLVKKGQTYWVVSCSTIGFTAKVNVDPNIMEGNFVLPENQPTTGMKRSLKEALTSPEKSTIVGKISQVSPVKHCRDGTLAVRTIALKDNSGKVAKVALFQENAVMDFLPQSIVEITAVYKKDYNDKPQLTATSSTICQFLPNETLDVTIEDNDMLQDDDFQIEDDASPGSAFKIDTILDAAIYTCCSNLGCRKKMKEKCPSCSGTTSEITCRVKVVSPLSTNDNLISELCDQLPVNFTAKLNKSKLFNITNL